MNKQFKYKKTNNNYGTIIYITVSILIYCHI